jgi:cytoskeletal protein CcmA (bactofilin family)
VSHGSVAREVRVMKRLAYFGGRQRRGVGLITVVLVSAVLLLSAMMFVNQLAAEGRITKTDAAFKSALSLAEGGATQVLSMMKGSVDPSGSVDPEYWALELASGSSEVGPVDDDRVHGTYDVALNVVAESQQTLQDNATATIVQHTGTVDLVSTGAIYPPSLTVMAGSTEYLARRAVKSRTTAVWTVTTVRQVTPRIYTPSTFTIKGGIMTGGNLTISGSAQEVHGDVYANGVIDLQKSTSVVDGTAYAGGGFSKKSYLPPGYDDHAPFITFPAMDAPTFKQLFTAYLNGTVPYDGTVAGFVNTSQLVPSNLNRLNPSFQAILAAAVPSGTEYLLNASTVPTWALLVPSAVYYIEGNLHLNGGDLSGTIYVKGNVELNGNVTVASGSSYPTIIAGGTPPAEGNITKNNGCSGIKGVLYCNGSYTGNGATSIDGALISVGSVNANGNFTIDATHAPGVIVGGGTWSGGGSTPLGTTYALNDLRLPQAADRQWQETIPQ